MIYNGFITIIIELYYLKICMYFLYMMQPHVVGRHRHRHRFVLMLHHHSGDVLEVRQTCETISNGKSTRSIIITGFVPRTHTHIHTTHSLRMTWAR
jgi:hypothetical protein